MFLAPVGYQKLFHAEGEKATRTRRGGHGAPLVVSTLATTRLEELTSFKAPLWFQLYLQARRSDSLDLVRRAEDCGCQALVVTVDAPVAGIRNREQRANFQLPPGIEAVNVSAPPAAPSQPLPPDTSVVFDRTACERADLGRPCVAHRVDIAAGRRQRHSRSGRCAARDQHGARGIIVSNHGGRVLDTLPASIDALPSMAAAVAGRVPLLLDGGIRRGSDIFKAIALGASAVLIGRPYVHALAAAGALGVAHVLRTLREELEVCMALSGCARLDAIDASRLFRVADAARATSTRSGLCGLKFRRPCRCRCRAAGLYFRRHGRMNVGGSSCTRLRQSSRSARS